MQRTQTWGVHCTVLFLHCTTCVQASAGCFLPFLKYDITCQNTGMAESTSMLFLRLDLVVFLLLFRDNIRDRHESNWRPKSLLRRLYCPASVHVVLWLGRENLTDTSCKDHLQNVIGFMTLKAYMILNRNENDRKIKKELMRSIDSGCSGHFPLWFLLLYYNFFPRLWPRLKEPTAQT